MKNDKPFYVAIDSDILRHLAYLELRMQDHEEITPEDFNDNLLVRDFNFYKRILEYAKRDEVRLLIVDAVFQESRHSNTLVQFMKEYCYFPNINAVNFQEKANKASVLAHAYCSEYLFEGQVFDPPMKSVFVADIHKVVPTNDAYIMAQATVEQCCLLTGNKRDFIFDEKQGEDNNARVIGIRRINKEHGYYEENEYGIGVAQPITINKLAGSLKRDERFGIFIQTDDKVPGKTIL